MDRASWLRVPTGSEALKAAALVLLVVLVAAASGATRGDAAGPAFGTDPAFGASGIAQVVFPGGTVDDLEGAASVVGANGVWLQAPDGSYQLLVVGGPAFLRDGLRSRFASGIGVTGVTLTRTSGAVSAVPPGNARANEPVAAAPTPLPCAPLEAANVAAMQWSAAETATLRVACDRILGLRAQAITVTVIDAEGKPLAGAPVRIEQQRHRFPFAVEPNEVERGVLSTSERATYDGYVYGLFNEAAVGFPWTFYEPTPGTVNPTFYERLVQQHAAHGVTIRGAALAYVLENPDWFTALNDVAQQMRSLEAHVRDLVSRFRGRMQQWVVVNEAKNTTSINTLRRGAQLSEPLSASALRGIGDYADPAFRWARASDPNAVLMINDNRIVSGRGTDNVEAILKELKQRSTPFDAVGVQAHMRAEGRVPLERVQANIDRLAPYGRLYLTELSVPARTFAPGDATFDVAPWDGWNETTQAAYTQAMVTLAFGNASFDGVTYWSMTDRRNDPSTNGTGLLRADLTPRPAYDALRRLIREVWWTTFDGTTDSEGRVRLTAFFGDYRVTTNGRSVDWAVDRGAGSFSVRLP